jgi:group I intron endonuclease
MPKEIICGIYLLVDKVSGKVYVGSSINILKRFDDHIRNLNNNKHSNYKLQKAWNTANILLELHIVEICNREDLSAREAYWLRLENAVRKGFNVTYDTRRNDSKASIKKRSRVKQV